MSSLILKIAACLTMLADHIGYHNSSLPALRMIGRISFPIFAYLIAFGYKKTSNPFKYLVRILLFGILSEHVYDYCFYGRLHVEGYNVMFTLALGLLAVILADRIRYSFPLSLLSLLPAGFCMFIAERFSTDYGAWGVALIVLYFYFCTFPESVAAGKTAESEMLTSDISARIRSLSLICAVTLAFAARFILKYYFLSAVACLSDYFPLISDTVITPVKPSEWQSEQIYAAFSLLFILPFNGKRGISLENKILRKIYSYSFYAFYPLHLLIIAIIER
ncbi:MAG: conjugal transfer protein TraX [Clostridia bacterium]|nr:conjugal transfer protein TraX [Clostridia bacterium]